MNIDQDLERAARAMQIQEYYYAREIVDRVLRVDPTNREAAIILGKIAAHEAILANGGYGGIYKDKGPGTDFTY